MAKFKPGQSGNPRGRPKGPMASTKLRDAIGQDLHAIVAALVEKAKDGDTAAAALLFSRTLPPLRPMTETPDIRLPGTTFGERAESVAVATLNGNISPTAASELMTILSAQARIAEISELAERLERIESAMKLEGKPK